MQKTPKVLSFPKHGLCYWKQIAYRRPKKGEFFLERGFVWQSNMDYAFSRFIIVPTFHAEQMITYRKGPPVEA